jgi:hypothetical protein
MGFINKNFIKIDQILSGMSNIAWIEIGVWKGEGARHALEHYDIDKMYLIDPYVPLPYLKHYFGTESIVNASKEEAHLRMEPYKDKVVFMEDFSENVCDEIPDNSCSVLFIDGNHSYESVLLDLKNFIPKVKPGGLIIGDDFNEEGVKKAIVEYAAQTGIEYGIDVGKDPTSKFYFIK